MNNFIGSIVLAIVVIFGYISGPIYKNFETSDTYINTYVKVITNDFQKNVRDCGYIDADMYNNYIDKLNKTGRMYDIEITYTQKLIYPNGANNFKTYYVQHGNSEIFKTIFQNKQKYNMKYGDDFNIVVTEKQEENSRLLASSLYLFSNDSIKLSFPYGGMIDNGS